MVNYSLQKQSERGERSQGKQEEGFTCAICVEPISLNKKFKIKESCDHPFCLDCIAKYIEVQIDDQVANIRCPELNCEQRLDPVSCRPIIPPSVFSKWCDVLCDSYILECERSYCPYRNCSSLVVNECGGTVKKTKCPNCKQFFCFQCKLKWHAGYRCEEAEHIRDTNDILFGQLLEANSWPRCPGCGHCIERREGCHEIKCRCNTYFCYRCGDRVSECMCDLDHHHCPSGVAIVLLIFSIIWLLIVVSTYNRSA